MRTQKIAEHFAIFLILGEEQREEMASVNQYCVHTKWIADYRKCMAYFIEVYMFTCSFDLASKFS